MNYDTLIPITFSPFSSFAPFSLAGLLLLLSCRRKEERNEESEGVMVYTAQQYFIRCRVVEGDKHNTW